MNRRKPATVKWEQRLELLEELLRFTAPLRPASLRHDLDERRARRRWRREWSDDVLHDVRDDGHVLPDTLEDRASRGRHGELRRGVASGRRPAP